MIVLDGVEWVTADEVREQLGDDITDPILWKWKQRGLVVAQRVGRLNLYRLDSALAAERATRGRTRPRRAGLLNAN